MAQKLISMARKLAIIGGVMYALGYIISAYALIGHIVVVVFSFGILGGSDWVWLM